MWVRQSDMDGAVTIGLVSLHKKEKTLDTSLSLCMHQGRPCEDTNQEKGPHQEPDRADTLISEL